MTTIVTKNGSGAPLASDLVQGELAVDLTNKRLYTEDTGGTVIELGSNPSTIDINAGTIDGTVIGGASAAAGTFTTFTSTGIDDNATSTAITIDSSQNVGIGETSPDSVLHVNSGTGNNTAFFESTDNGAIVSIADNAGSIQLRAIDTGDFVVQVGGDGATTGTNSTEAMRIDSSGNVGIGTANNSYTATGRGNLTIAGSGGAILGFQIGGSAKGYVFHDSTNIQVWNEVAGLVLFGTNATERMRIDSSGNLLVGKTTDPTVGIGQYIKPTGETFHTVNNSYNTLHVYNVDASAFRFYVGQNGTVHATNTSISAISDASLKENVRDLDKGLDAVLALQPRRFDWKNGDGNDIMGFIAQEVEEVMPELIDEAQYNKDETKKSLKMGDMIPSMVKAIQEQQAMIEELKAEVAALKGA